MKPKPKTYQATKGNVSAAIKHAIKVFEFLEENQDLVNADPSNKGIARTLNENGIRTRFGKFYDGTSIRRLMEYKKHYKSQSSDKPSLRKFI